MAPLDETRAAFPCPATSFRSALLRRRILCRATCRLRSERQRKAFSPRGENWRTSGHGALIHTVQGSLCRSIWAHLQVQLELKRRQHAYIIAAELRAPRPL